MHHQSWCLLVMVLKRHITIFSTINYKIGAALLELKSKFWLLSYSHYRKLVLSQRPQNAVKFPKKRCKSFCNVFLQLFLAIATILQQSPYCSAFWKQCNKVLQCFWNGVINNKFAAVFHKHCNKVRFATFFKTLLKVTKKNFFKKNYKKHFSQ